VLHGLRLLASLLVIVRGGLRSLTHHLLGLVPHLGTSFLLSVVALGTGFLGSVTALSAASNCKFGISPYRTWIRAQAP